jgi:5-bromo-4-chloroindolyl phosphate hydrolysis protein
MEQGTSTFMAGLAAAVVLPVCVLVLGLPLWLGAVVAAGIFVGLHLALRSRGFGLKLDDMAEARSETVRALIDDGRAALERLASAAKSIRDAGVRAVAQSLVKTATDIIGHVEEQPERAMAVRRFLTFYLPNAAAIAQGWCTLEGNAQPSAERMTQTREVLTALKDAFAKFENQADAPELEELDLSLKVMKDSLKAELEKNI